MKTAIDKNETYFQRLKRESFEWLEKLEGAGRTVPPFIHLALNVLKEWQSEQTDLHPVFDKDYLNECIAKSRLNQPDINTPFFGNSGAKIPIEQPEPDSLTIDEVKPELQEAFKILESEFSKTACQSLSYPQMIHVLCAMDDHAARTERESCKKCAMANWPTKGKTFQLSDEEFKNKLAIEIIARFSIKTSRGTSIARNGFIDGAKWYRDQVQIYRREELIKFVEWCNDNLSEDTCGIYDFQIDEYLKQK